MFEKLVWKKDRILLDDLVFRLEHSKDDDWELGEECFQFYKGKGVVYLYKRFFSRSPDFFIQNMF